MYAVQRQNVNTHRNEFKPKISTRARETRRDCTIVKSLRNDNMRTNVRRPERMYH